MSKIIEFVKEQIEPVLQSSGYELVDLEYKKEGKARILRIYIDSLRGIQVEDCVVVNNLCEPILDQISVLQEQYTLEVSSPGIFRPLNRPEHFERFVGQTIRVKLFKGMDGWKQSVGQLTQTTKDGIRFRVNGANQETFIPYQLIAKSNLEPELKF